MKASFYVVIEGAKRRNWDAPELGTISVRKTKPKTGANEVSVLIDLDIPDALFEQPTLHVKASLPNLECSGNLITAEVAENIAEVIRERTGLAVTITAGGEEQAS